MLIFVTLTERVNLSSEAGWATGHLILIVFFPVVDKVSTETVEANVTELSVESGILFCKVGK